MKIRRLMKEIIKKYKLFIKGRFILLGLSLLIGGWLVSCGEIKRVDTKAVKDHINDYKIKKADQATIVLQAEQWSHSLTDSLVQRWSKKVASAKNAQERLSICQPMQDAWLDSLNKVYDLEVDFWGKTTSAENLALPQEKELFLAYQYAIENNLPLESNLQKSGDSLFLFTRSIPGVAATCFGDSALGLSIVRVKIPKAAVVKSIPFRKK